MNVRELKEKLRGLDDDLLVVLEDNTVDTDDPDDRIRDAYTLQHVRVIELYPGRDALALGYWPSE